MHNHTSTTFWEWFLKQIIFKERLTLPNLGVFSLQYRYEEYEIDFKATGSFKKALQLSQHLELDQSLYFTGDRHPSISVKKWGPIIRRTNNVGNLSLHRRLIWDFAQETELTLDDSANICSTEINRMTAELLKNKTVSLLPEWHMKREIDAKIQWQNEKGTPTYSNLITSTIDSEKIYAHLVRYNIE